MNTSTAASPDVSGNCMTSLSKISTVLFITFFLSCHSTSKETKSEIAKDSIVEAESSIIHPNNSLTDTVVQGKCVIDTVAILQNQNLLPLIEELSRTKLNIYKTTKAIPPVILNFLKCSVSGEFSIASPGENWQVTDVIMEELPTRQLIFIGVADSIALMAHFTGGIGKSEHLLIFKFNDKDVTNFWCGNVLTDLTDKEQTLQFLKKNMNKEWGLNTNIIYF